MEKLIRRYSAFIPRWCQAFGDHAPDPGGEGRAVEWLVGSDSVGVVVLPEVRRLLTHDRAIDMDPLFSRDGKRVALPLEY